MTRKPEYDLDRLKAGLKTIDNNIDRINCALEYLRDQCAKEEDEIQIARLDVKINELMDGIRAEEDQKIKFKVLIKEREML